MKFTVYKEETVLGVIEANDLDEAEKIGNKKYPKWTDIYIGEKPKY
jgi:hypothetical protein